MFHQPVSPEPGRDEDPGRAEEDWLAWCEALEASGQPLDPDEEEPDEDAAPRRSGTGSCASPRW